MTRVLLDQGLPRSTAADLRGAGWDALHVGELAMSRSEDTEILAFAARESRVIVTLDADFHALLAVNTLSEPSVIRIRIEGLQGVGMSRLLLRIWPGIEASLETGAIVTITERQIRIRNLPVR